MARNNEKKFGKYFLMNTFFEKTHEAALSIAHSHFRKVGQAPEAAEFFLSQNERVGLGYQDTGGEGAREHGTLLKQVTLHIWGGGEKEREKERERERERESIRKQRHCAGGRQLSVVRSYQGRTGG